MSTVLQGDYTIPFSPKLAKILGVNEAIVIQQVHYWLEKYKDSPNHQYDGHCWVYNTFEEWHEQFPFWSIATVKRTFYNLIEKKILITGWFNKKAYDHTNWYTINFEMLESLVNTDCINLIQSNVSNCTNREYQIDPSNTIDYSENNSSIEKQLNDNYITFFSKAEKSQSDDLDFNIIERQIRKYCEENDCEEYTDNLIGTFRYFYDDYERCFGKDHTILSQKNIEKVCEVLIDFSYSTLGIYNLHDYKVMIYHYLRTDYKKATNYSILHFTTKGIMTNLYYKYIYQGEDAVLPFC